MGRAFTSGMSIASKGALLTSSASAQQSIAGPAHDQPELDARYVYVGVHADGPTRVLCFSDTRDQYTRGTNEESVALLSSKLKRLEERIQVRGVECALAPCLLLSSGCGLGQRGAQGWVWCQVKGRGGNPCE